jgi:hypothetical protein
MRAIFEIGASHTPFSSVAYRNSKRLFRMEISNARRQERLRMAQSRDWSGLGEYVRASTFITCHQVLLDTSGVFAILSIPKGRALFERATAAILRAAYATRSRY